MVQLFHLYTSKKLHRKSLRYIVDFVLNITTFIKLVLESDAESKIASLYLNQEIIKVEQNPIIRVCHCHCLQMKKTIVIMINRFLPMLFTL